MRPWYIAPASGWWPAGYLLRDRPVPAKARLMLDPRVPRGGRLALAKSGSLKGWRRDLKRLCCSSAVIAAVSAGASAALLPFRTGATAAGYALVFLGLTSRGKTFATRVAQSLVGEVQDLESILDECLGVGVPAVELTWHYRSRHESLIAFSNQAYYGGRLVTFPSPVTRDGAVSFRHVPDGVYARAGARTNLPEARAVVAEALALLRDVLAGGRPRSLGIVTFNAEQQALIENLLDEAARGSVA